MGFVENVNNASAIAAEIIVVDGISTEVVTVAAIDTEVVAVSGIAAEVVITAGDTAAINTVAGDTVEINEVATDLAKGIGTNQPTDSAILNALTNANQTISDVALTNADVVLTGADVDSTNADVVLTNADVVLTGADVDSTNADVVLTHADVVLTNADVVLTGNDVVLTGNDVVSTNADVVLTGLDVVSAASSAAAAANSASVIVDPFKGLLTSSGTISKAVSDLVFETVVGNEYKMADKSRFANLDGNVLDTYGDELVINGNGESLTGWASVSGATLSVVDGSIVASMGATNGGFSQSIVTEVGKRYSWKYTSKGARVAFFNVDGVQLTYGISTGAESGKWEGTFTASSISSSLAILQGTTADVSDIIVDNISVKEITTVDMTNYIPEVTVQDQATNGLVVQSSVLAGDYVVVDKVGTTNTQSVAASTTDIDVGSSAVAATFEVGLEIAIKNLTTLVTFTANITAINTSIITTDVTFARAANQYTVEVTKDIRRATEDTVDMHDVAGADAGQTTGIVKAGEVVFFNSTYDSPNTFWLREGSDTTAYAFPANYDFSASFTYLGTATNMSLLNPYFETRDYVSNQVLAYRKTDGTLGYEVLFVDASKSDTVHDAMLANGWSKLSNGWYSKGLILATPLGTWQSLNKGAYHEFVNKFGTGRFSNTAGDSAKYWYDSTARIANNIADTFDFATDGYPYLTGIAYGPIGGTGAIGTTNGHPDAKYYDIIYPDQWQDWRVEANECLPQEELLAIGGKAKSGNLDGVSGLVATYGYLNNIWVSDATLGSYPIGTSTMRVKIAGNVFSAAFGDVYGSLTTGMDNGIEFMIGSDTRFYYVSHIYFDNTNTFIDIGSDVDISADFSSSSSLDILKVITLPILSRGSHLTTDLIGDPANYPQDMKDILASGKPLIGINPLLVGQDGTDYTSFVGTQSIIFSDKKIIDLVYVVWDDVFAGYTSGAVAIDSVSNEMLVDDRNYMVYYTAKNTTTNISDPKAVKAIGNYATGTNSHSVYKCNQLVPTGKVNVGNGANGLESRGLENAVVGGADFDGYATGYTVVADTTVIYCNVLGIGIDTGIIGHYYKRIGAGFTWTIALGLDNPLAFEDLGTSPILSTPDHNTITLDNANSPAVKFFETIATDEDGMAHYQVMAEEMINDTTIDNVTEAISITDGVGSLTYTLGETYLFQDSAFGNFEGVAITMTATQIGWTAAQIVQQWTITSNGTVVGADGNTEYAVLWTNGFGSDGKFNQLTNGTRTDLNGNAVKTIVSSIPLNKYFRR